jgi:hypothetical protein
MQCHLHGGAGMGFCLKMILFLVFLVYLTLTMDDMIPPSIDPTSVVTLTLEGLSRE